MSDLAPRSRPQFESTEQGVVLIGTLFQSSGIGVFPARELCPATGRRDGVEMRLGPAGQLYSYSTVHVSTSKQTPYTIGYVDFPEGVRVLAEIRGDLDSLRCDSPIRLDAHDGDWFAVAAGGKEFA